MNTVRSGVGYVAMLAALSVALSGQGPMHHGAMPSPERGASPPIRTTMEQLHAQGGVPQGWTFEIPAGDAAAGRKAFVALECFACHTVKGEDFPSPTKVARGPGPELTGMGAHHPAEYFAESIVNPNRVIVTGSGYTGPDGLSKMPDYSDSLTVRQLIDLVAYLKSLRDEDHGTHGGGGKMKM